MDKVSKINTYISHSIKKIKSAENKLQEKINQTKFLSHDYQSFINTPRAVFVQPSWVVELNQPLSNQSHGRVQILKTRLGEVQVFGAYVHHY